jgi:hypothetical protein
MYLKLFGIGLILFGSYLIYIKRHLSDDSQLLGTVLILAGLVIATTGWMMGLDPKRK